MSIKAGMRRFAKTAQAMGAAKAAATAADAEEEKRISSPTYSLAADAAPAAAAPAAAKAEPVQKYDAAALGRRYDVLRGRAKADVSDQTAQQDDALKRRFAALGNLNSGAALKQQQLTQERGAQLQQRATEGIDMAQSQEEMQLQEVDRGRQFARDERMGSQEFASGERRGAQEFASLERKYGQEFASKESAAGRDMASRQFKASMEFEQSKFGQSFAEQVRMNNLEEKVQQFNMEMARDAANQKDMFTRAGDMGTRFFQGNTGGGTVRKIKKANPRRALGLG